MKCDKKITNRENKDSNFTKFNYQTYVVHLYLCNQDNIVELGWTNVKSLIIEEDIFKWYATGSLVFGDQYGVLQKPPMEMTGNSDKQQVKPYKFRGDGKDILIVDIWPSTHEANGQPTDESSKTDFKKWEHWLLHYRFAVYDVEDVSSNDNDFKSYKLYFWEEPYQKLLDQNMEWSTAKSKFIDKKGLKIPVYRMSDEDRSLKTGQALIDLLQTAGLEQHFEGDDPDAPDNFDMGDENNTIFYTSPSQNTVIDDLDYIVDRHVSEKEQDLCLLQMERSKEEEGEPKTFSFKPFISYCEKAGKSAQDPGEDQIEHFFFYEPGPENADKTQIKTPKAPMGDKDDRDFKATHFNIIYTFKYVEMSGLDSAAMWKARPMYHFCKGKKQFVFDFWDHKPSVAKQHMVDNYLSQLYSKNSKDVLIHSNQAKIEATNCSPTYTNIHSLNGRKAHGRNRLLETGIQLNSCISFGAAGLTIRQPGKFIGIDKMHNDQDNDYDNRLCGQWFLTKVTHMFAVGDYITHMTAVKIHNFETKTQLSEESVV